MKEISPFHCHHYVTTHPLNDGLLVGHHEEECASSLGQHPVVVLGQSSAVQLRGRCAQSTGVRCLLDLQEEPCDEFWKEEQSSQTKFELYTTLDYFMFWLSELFLTFQYQGIHTKAAMEPQQCAGTWLLVAAGKEVVLFLVLNHGLDGEVIVTGAAFTVTLQCGYL